MSKRFYIRYMTQTVAPTEAESPEQAALKHAQKRWGNSASVKKVGKMHDENYGNFQALIPDLQGVTTVVGPDFYVWIDRTEIN